METEQQQTHFFLRKKNDSYVFRLILFYFLSKLTLCKFGILFYPKDVKRISPRISLTSQCTELLITVASWFCCYYYY